MTLQQQVSSFIASRAPNPVCNACVADHLALSARQVSRVPLRADARLSRFSGRCSGCCTTRKVTVLVG